MTDRVRAWWQRSRHADCAVCGTEFRKGQGGGVSREMLCSDACYRQAWTNYIKGTG